MRHAACRHLFLAQVAALLGTGMATVALGLLAHDLAGASAGQILGAAPAIKMVARNGGRGLTTFVRRRSLRSPGFKPVGSRALFGR